MAESFTNWAGTHTFRPNRLHRPSTIDELRSVVSRAPRIHAIGARHCFNDIADAPELISLEALPDEIAIDRERRTVSFNAGIRYHDLCVALEREGFALHNIASLAHVTVAGAVATATHGSGDRNRNLASAVCALELVTSDGELVRVGRGHPEFTGMVVNLGALGVVTRLTLEIEQSYQVRQEVFQHLAWDVLFDRFDAVTSGADSVSLFTDYGATVNQVWAKTRLRPGDEPARASGFHGAAAAARRLNPVAEFAADHCTEQLGIPGPWHERLPHFMLAAVSSRGDHIQSEYMVPRRHGVAAIRALRSLSAAITPRLTIAEIRTVAGDDLWLSSAYGTDVVCLHFSWKPDLDAVLEVLPAVEAALAPYAARPHWGKLFLATAAELEPRFERLPDFRRLADRLDPRRAFRNAFLERAIFG